MKRKTKKEYTEQMNRIYDQIKHRENALKNDFSCLYTNFSMSIAFYGTIIVFISKNVDIDIFILYCFVFLLIPGFTYIFGLLFCYNLYAITKGGYVTTTLENKLEILQKKLYDETEYIGWGIVEKKRNIGRLLVYGTILTFYILLPMVSIIWGIIIVRDHQFDVYAICFIVISILVYAVYILFLIIIITEMRYFYKKFQENHNYNT